MMQYSDYTTEQIDLMQRFVDYYLKYPLGVIFDGFVAISLDDDKEARELENLAGKGVFEIRKSTEQENIPTVYRMSTETFNMLTRFEREGKLPVKGFSN